jgi:hypothetical protein
LARVANGTTISSGISRWSDRLDRSVPDTGTDAGGEKGGFDIK